jgi:hypothetical protein
VFCNEVKAKSGIALTRSYTSAFVLLPKLREATAEEMCGRVVGGEGKEEIDGEVDRRSARSRCRLLRSSSIVIVGLRSGCPFPTESGASSSLAGKHLTKAHPKPSESGARWTDFRNNPVTIGDQNRLAAGGEPDVLTKLF